MTNTYLNLINTSLASKVKKSNLIIFLDLDNFVDLNKFLDLDVF